MDQFSSPLYVKSYVAPEKRAHETSPGSSSHYQGNSSILDVKHKLKGGLTMQAMVVSKDQSEKDIIVYILRQAGLAVDASSDLQRVLTNWTDSPADIIIVAHAESEQPLENVRALRSTVHVPLLMIVETVPEITFCALLEAGADVVLNRPVSPQVLSAYVFALLRRSSSVPSFVLPTLALENITLDPSTRSVTITGEEPRRLTHLEFRLLYTLMTNRGQVVPVDVIIERVWGYTGEGNRDLVRGLISRLRQKIEPDPASTTFLETIPSVGYRFLEEKL
jgi:DNA-binding response OmpR family regulator